MKKAYVDISLEGLADLLQISLDPYECVIEKFEQSPEYTNSIRLHLSGDTLPAEEAADPVPVKLMHTKEWTPITDHFVVQKITLEIVNPTRGFSWGSKRTGEVKHLSLR